MGFPMAQNLRASMPASSTLIVCELVKPVREKFLAETKGDITTAENPREIANRAVSESDRHRKN